MNYAKALRKAADLIEERGWHQNAYQGPNGKLCMLGAYYTALTRRPYFSPLRPHPEGLVYMREALGEQLPSGLSIADWNDTQGRTAEEVTAALRKAADLAEQA